MAIGNSNISLDQEKYLVKKLLDRSYLRCVMASACDKIPMAEGAGLVAYMVRYERMNVPLATLTEGVTPADTSTFSLSQVTVQLDQWGDYLVLTDVAQLTAKHPLMQQAVELLADNAARVMDREITNVLLAGTNVQFGDGSVASRDTITSSMKINEQTIQRARIALVNAGAPPRGVSQRDAKQVNASGTFQNGSLYLAIAGPEVCADIQQPSTSFGTFASVATYANSRALMNSEVGIWQGFRWVETNFIPRFSLLGNSTVAVTSGSAFGTNTPTITSSTTGGSLAAATYAFKIVRKDLQRGFSENISIAHTQAIASGTTGSFTVSFAGLAAGFAYDVYFAKAATLTTDANLGLIASNVAVGSSVVITALAGAATQTPPQNINVTAGVSPSLVHPIFTMGEGAVAWVGFYNTKFLMTGNTPDKSDPLAQRRTAGYKFFGKAVIKDQTRLLRIEIASTY
ncbi:MAG: N4-gp56 family major capsid protein [Solirubrobacterales bacterium]